MAKITGQQNINIGLPNEAANSDSLYTAFNKIQDNFDILFESAANVVAGNGITVTNNTGNTVVSAKIVAGQNIEVANIAGGAVQITAAGERYLSNSSTPLALGIGNGKSVIISSNLSYIPQQTVIVAYDSNNYMVGPVVSYTRSNGNLVFNSTTSNGSGTYSFWQVNLNGAAATGTGGGTITGVTAGTGLTGGGNVGPVTLALATSGVNAATYTNPTITVDSFGRITTAANNNVSGTVTSIGLTAGSGIQIAGGPVTTAGNITVTNLGVTRIIAGNNISVTQPNGEVRIDAASFNGVTSILLQSSSLNVSPNSAQTGTATFTVNLPNNAVRWATNAPSTNTSAGTAGQVAYDAGGNLYICVNTNTWSKITGTTSW